MVQCFTLSVHPSVFLSLCHRRVSHIKTVLSKLRSSNLVHMLTRICVRVLFSLAHACRPTFHFANAARLECACFAMSKVKVNVDGEFYFCRKQGKKV